MKDKKLFNQSGVGAIVVLIILSLVAGTAVLIKKSNPKSEPTQSVPPVQSAEGVPILSFISDSPSTVSDGNFNLILKVNPNGAEFHAFELYADYDSLKEEPQDLINLSANIISSYPLINSSIDPVNGTITVIGTRTGSPFIGTEPVEVARVKMKLKPGTQGTADFSWGDNTKLGNKLPLQKVDRNF